MNNSTRENFTISLNIPRELQLLILLSRKTNVNPGDFQNIHWELFVQHAKNHKLIPYLFQNKKEIKENIPPVFFTELENDYRQKTFYHLTIVNELTRLNSIFNKNGVEHLFLKGPVLSLQLYDDINSRYYRDLDILVDPRKIKEAERLLEKHGYQKISPSFSLSPKQSRYNLSRTAEVVFTNPGRNVLIELHWRLFNNRYLMNVSFNELYDNSVLVTAGGKAVKTLGEMHKVLYLACHGSYHHWIRLFWLRDFAELLHDKKDDFFEKVISLADKKGLSRVFARSVQFCLLVFNSPGKIPEFINQERWDGIIKHNLKAIKKCKPGNQFNGRFKFSSMYYLARLKKDSRYKFETLKPLLPHHDDWRIVNLPDSLFFLYYPLRPFLWLFKIFRK